MLPSTSAPRLEGHTVSLNLRQQVLTYRSQVTGKKLYSPLAGGGLLRRRLFRRLSDAIEYRDRVVSRYRALKQEETS